MSSHRLEPRRSRRPSSWPTACALALLCLAPAAQSGDPQGEEHGRHLRAVYAERLFHLQQSFEEASPDARMRLESYLGEALGDGAPLGAWPNLITLTRGARVLAGADEATGDASDLQALVDSIDVELAPGCFDPAMLGEPVIARIYPADARAAALSQRSARVSLLWLDEAGVELRARSEPVADRVWVRPGFNMYLRTPEKVGDWRLVLEVVEGEEAVRSGPISLEWIPGFRRRFDAAYARLARREWSGEHLLLEGLRRRLGYGQRRAATALSFLQALEAEGPIPGMPRPHLFPGDVAAVERRMLWNRHPLRRSSPGSEPLLPVAAIVLPSPSRLDPDALFEGPAGEAWRREADERGWLLVSVAMDAAPLADVVAEVRALLPGRAVGLVARGDAAAKLLADLLVGRDPGADFLGLCAEQGASAKLLPEVPVLLATPSPETAGGVDREAGSEISRAPLPASPFLSETELPAIVGRWFERLEGLASGER